VGIYISIAIREFVLRFLKKLKMELPVYPALSLVSIYPKEMKAVSLLLCVEVLFTITKT
jgi:hypothetical protein